MKIVVFGESGYLGVRIIHDLRAEGARGADITRRESVHAVLDVLRPDVVVNAAGKTGRPNVDWCESHRIETYRANVVGPLVLAEECYRVGVHLVHLGSGCIFYGRPSHDPWWEDDYANPVSYYSKTKYAADLCLATLPNVAVVRLRMPIDGTPHPRNLITKLAGYSQVIDVANSVTVVSDLVEAIRQIAERRLSGIFHAVNPGVVSHREILRLYREVVDPSHRAEFISEADLVAHGLALKTRSNCVLADTRLAAAGIHMRPIAEALPKILQEYATAARGAA